MHICYVDESGNVETLYDPAANTQPALIIAGMTLRQSNLANFSQRFLCLKQKFYPRRLPATANHLSWILPEIKGSDIRRQLRSGRRKEFRHAIGLLDSLLDLLREFDCRFFARIWIKEIGAAFDGRAVYTYSVQRLLGDFQEFLAQENDFGAMTCDARNKGLNVPVAHSIFTQKFKATGDTYPSIIDVPSFGHSDNHAGLQAADWLCSALLFPIACYAYCDGHIQNVHVNPIYKRLRNRFGPQLKELQFRYRNAEDRWIGGITVSDKLGCKNGTCMFKEPPQLVTVIKKLAN